MKKLISNISVAVFIVITVTNSFAQWTLQSSLSGLGSYPFISVYGPGELVVAGGTSGFPKVFKSVNSGVSWTNISGNLTGPEIFSIWAVNANLIFAGDGGSNGGGGGNARVWKTTDGGVTWSVILTTGGTHGFFDGIVFSRANPLIGIAVSDPPTTNGPHYLAKTVDGGNTWNTQTTISTNGGGIAGTVMCIDNLFYGWGLLAPARVLLTTNGGISWDQRNISNAYYTSGLAFSSDKTMGVGVSQNFYPSISRTTDGGVTWTVINTGLPLSITAFGRAKWVYGTNTCYITSEGGTGGCVGKSTDGGLTWSLMSTSGQTGFISIELVVLDGVVSAYAVSTNGSVIKLSEPLGITPISSNVPAGYHLSQNYPNPFNPGTKIKFDVAPSKVKGETSNVNLTIYNVLGKEVVTLVNENLKPGTYQVDFNASNYPSGIYYYKLTSGNFTETKKMSLIK